MVAGLLGCRVADGVAEVTALRCEVARLRGRGAAPPGNEPGNLATSEPRSPVSNPATQQPGNPTHDTDIPARTMSRPDRTRRRPPRTSAGGVRFVRTCR